MKLLYIGSEIETIRGGADQVNRRNQKILREVFNEDITFMPLEVRGFVDKFFLGVTGGVMNRIDSALSAGDFTHVFVAQSLSGRAVRYIKRHYPKLTVITFFHNIEIDYATAFLHSKGMKSLPFYVAVKIWERMSCKYSDKFITLNQRDSKRLKEVYGKTADCELPTSFDDRYDALRAQQFDNGQASEITFLFVGVAFFPNIEGVQWFITNILPHVEGNLYVIGNRMDEVKFNDVTDRVKILGYVDDLSEYYYKARFVISPIFSGAGMKTKTAEALMYGKTIIGTSEAFEGYHINPNSMFLCNTAEEWMTVISNIKDIESNVNEEARTLFEQNYSTSKLKNKIHLILKK